MRFCFAAFFSLLVAIASAEPSIYRIEPLSLTIGETTEVVVIGDRMTHGENEPGIWSGFPATWEFVPSDKPANRERKYRVTVPAEAKPGPGAIRVWNQQGISRPFLLLKTQTATNATTLRLSHEAVEHIFRVEARKPTAIEVWSNRLNQDTDLVMTLHDADGTQIAKADDDDVVGADPRLIFTPENTGDYHVKLHDIQYRGGAQSVLTIGDPRPAPEARFRTSNSAEPIKFSIAEPTHFAITPKTHSIGSPALLLIDLHESKSGNRIARSGSGDVLDEVMRRFFPKPGDYELRVRDLLGREGLPFDLDFSKTIAPFQVQLENRSKDRHVVKPGAEVKLFVRVTRYQFDGAIQIRSDAFELENAEIPEKKNNVEMTLKIPADAKPGSLIAFRLTAEAEHEGKTYTSDVLTTELLKKTPAHLLQWPDGLDGQLYAVIARSDKPK